MENRIGFGRRLAAFFIDCVLVTGISMLLGPTIGGVLGAAAGGVAAGLGPGDMSATQGVAMGGVVGAVLGMVLALFVVGTAYFLIEGFTGWTFGKLILGIQVANADGTAAALPTLLKRYALKNVNFLLGFIAAVTGMTVLRTLGNLFGFAIFIGCFFVLGAAHQAFHDMLAKTAVYPRTLVRAA
jgi:uncharacterized RDD family membrane protein YckC